MNSTSTMKKPFPVAAIFFLIYGIFRFGTFIYNVIEILDNSYGYGIVSEVVRAFIPLIFLALAITLLIIRKNNIVFPILIGVLLIVWDLYWFICDFEYNIEFLDETWVICTFLSYILDIVAFVFIILFAILSLVSKQKKCGFLVVWFIPGILFTISEILVYSDLFLEIEYLDYYFESISGIIYILTIFASFALFIPGMFLLGYWFYKENQCKTLGGASMFAPAYGQAPAYNNQYAQPNQQYPYNQQYAQPNQQYPYNQQYAQPNQQYPYNQQYAQPNQQPVYNQQYAQPNQQPIYNQQYAQPNQQPIYNQQYAQPNQQPAADQTDTPEKN